MCLSTRTSPQGLVLVFETKGRVRVKGRVVGGGGKGRGTTQTQRMGPQGCVLCVWVVGRARETPDMKNTTLWSCSSCLGGRRGRGHPRHKECDPVVTFFVSGWWEGEGTPQTQRMRPYGRVLHDWVVGGGGYTPDMKNATL